MYVIFRGQQNHRDESWLYFLGLKQKKKNQLIRSLEFQIAKDDNKYTMSTNDDEHVFYWNVVTNFLWGKLVDFSSKTSHYVLNVNSNITQTGQIPDRWQIAVRRHFLDHSISTWHPLLVRYLNTTSNQLAQKHDQILKITMNPNSARFVSFGRFISELRSQPPHQI